MIVWKHALLTGATGALGPGLAAELLASNNIGTLAVLIRPDGNSVTERFNSWLGWVNEILEQKSLLLPGWRDRLIPVAADVRLDNLGMSADISKRLRQQTDLVIHAAADTGFKSAAKDQWDTNVEGTRHAIQFAKSCRKLPRFIFVSTVCTSGQRTGRIDETFTPTPPEFVNNYERTKWEAERLVMESGLHVALARVSIVMGSHATGAVYRAGALHQIFKWFGRGMVPVIQGAKDSLLDLICTETATTFVARAAQNDWPAGSIWHIAASDRATPLMELAHLGFWELLGSKVVQNTEQPGQPFIVDGQTFQELMPDERSPRQRIMRQAMDSLATFLPMLSYPRIYDTTQAEQFWGGPLPMPDWKLTMQRVIHYLELAPKRHRQAG